MAGSAGSIYVDLLLRDSNYRQGWNRARGYTKQGASQISGDVNKIGQSFTGVINPVNNLGSALRNLSGVIAGAFSVQKIIQYNDTWTQLEGRLSLVTSSMGELVSVQQELFDIAQRSRQPVEGVYNLYTRLAQAIPEAQRAQYDLLGVTESINQALAITGEGSAQASSAILQFTQAVASGFKGSGQEINALLDSAPRLARALQNAFGDGQKSLKQLAADGELDLDRILKALAGTGEEGRKLREEFAKIPPTVGQAFTQLDNAFLQFIGQSQAVQAGTSSLVTVIQALSRNLELVANAAIILSGIFAGRLLQPLNGFIAAVGRSISVNSQLASSASSYAVEANRAAQATQYYAQASGQSARVAQALAKQQLAAAGSYGQTAIAVNSAGLAITRTTSIMATASAVVRGLGSSLLAAFGGPIGVAVIGAISLLTLESDYAADAQKRLNDEVQNFSSEASKYAQASDELKIKIRQDTQDRIKEYEKELLAIQELYKAYNEQGFFGKFLDNLGSSARRTFGLGGGQGVRDIVGEGAALENAINRLKDLQDTYNQVDSPSINRTVGVTEETKKSQKELQSVYQRNLELITGLDSATLKYNDTVAELNELLKANVITDGQFNDAIQRLNESFNENRETVNSWGIDVESFGKKAAENIQDAFADFLFDPFDQGLDGMLKGFVDTIRRMLAEAQAAQLAKALFGETAGGKEGGLFGSLGNIFGSQGGLSRLFQTGSAGFIGPLPAFADGGYLGPGQFGIAGEAGAELIYGGKTGVSVFNQDQIGSKGNVYQIDARGADQGAVARLEQALLALAGPGVIEQRVVTAQARGAL